jgi:hypothetical protein
VQLPAGETESARVALAWVQVTAPVDA